MKMKVSLDQNSIKGFFAQHAEKLVFVGVVAAFLLFVYSAIGRETFQTTPEELSQKAKQAQEYLARSDVGKNLEDLRIKPYDRVAPEGPGGKGVAEEGQGDPYEWDIAFNPPLFVQRPKRPVPPVYSVTALKGSASFGAFNMRTERSRARRPARSTSPAPSAYPGMPGMMGPMGPMGSTPGTPPANRREGIRRSTQPRMPTIQTEKKGQRWVCLVGLVPWKKQIKAYQEAFKESAQYRPQSDFPNYIYYRVQRVDVTNGSLSDAQMAQRATALKRNKAYEYIQENWAQMGQEVVDPRYIHPQLTFPLGPLVGEKWGEEVTFDPEIPLGMSAATIAAAQAKARAEAAAVKEETTADEEEDLPDLPKRGRMPGASPMFPGAGMGGSEGSGYSMMPGYSSMPGGYPSMGSEMYPGGSEGMYATGGVQQQEIENKLFRFFDFNVEPGRKYRYRVQLLVMNPNYQVESRFLADITSSEEMYLESKWEDCPWTEPITVPRDDRVMAVRSKPAPTITKPPSARILALKWLMDKGLEAAEEFDVEPGQVANFSDRKYPPDKAAAKPKRSDRMRARRMRMMPGSEMMMGSGSEMYPGMMGEGMMPGYSEGSPSGSEMMSPEMMYPGMEGMTTGAPKEEKLEVDYLTDMVLLDLRGGEPFNKEDAKDEDAEVVPGQMIFLGPEGDLMVRDEMADRPQVEKHTLDPRAISPGGMYPGMEGSYPGMDGSSSPEMYPSGSPGMDGGILNFGSP